MAFFDAFKDTVQLVKNTFAVIGKNPAILTPTIKQAWIVGITLLVILLGIAAIVFKYSILPTIGIIVLVACTLFLAFVFPFVKIHYKAAQCWMVYQTFSGKPVTYEEGLERARVNRKDIFVLGVFDILLRLVANELKQGTRKRGMLGVIISIIMKIAGKVVEEGWDLIGHYLLPAAIIKEQTVREALPEIKNIKSNVPAALMGVFGFDFIGDLISKYFVIMSLPFIFLVVVLGAKFSSWIPFALFMIILVILIVAVQVVIDMAKVIYFTLFYMSITMPDKISKQYRAEVTNYLLSNKGRRGTTSRPLGNI
ncbi:MAG TPA: hypothetical protein HA362_08135 [Nanoarchaeota archaeon]|nr:hypothetical protein [Nanoarchaeota archaeon]